MKATPAISLVVALAAGVAPTARAQDASYPDAVAAFAAGVKMCSVQFDNALAKKAFGLSSDFVGFVAAPEDAQAPGVRSLTLTSPGALVLKAVLAADAKGAVHVVVGPNPQGLPQCRTLATEAPGAEVAAVAWLNTQGSGFTLESPAKADDTHISELHLRPFRDNILVGATVMWPIDYQHRSITALSTLTLARK